MGKRSDKNGAENEYVPPERDPVTRKFVPGNKGGPGRPRKENTISDRLRAKLLDEVVVEERVGRKTVKVRKTYLELFVESQIKRAINGDGNAARNVWDRVDGKSSLLHEISNADGEPFTTQSNVTSKATINVASLPIEIAEQILETLERERDAT